MMIKALHRSTPCDACNKYLIGEVDKPDEYYEQCGWCGNLLYGYTK